MDSDSITTTTPIPSATNAKNLGKKKKINWSSKLKQNKVDARREQWLSQGPVKNMGCKDGEDNDSHVLPPPPHSGKHSKDLLEKLEIKRGRGQEDNGSMIHQDSDWESLTFSPTSNVFGINFTGSSSSRSSSSSSAGCCSGDITEENEEEEECLDDWEAVADALAANENQQHQNPCPDSPISPIVQTGSRDGSSSGATNSKLESARLVPWASGNTRAWRADDAFRPRSLPNLSKQLSMPNPDRYCGGGSPWTRPTMSCSCPICCEDLDLTDSSFLPCLCGFRLCLFCHKRILEEDGRCPGCRKPYECEPVKTEAKVTGGSLTLRLVRSFSLIERS
ncbi:hypothetical protein TanjilG_29061 [Lupinus angustifolius]|uniref:RING-type domain-containing protein n=1 Tax=Lupinus angustifolius TaxID=3871 RepID=A0A4P1RSU7_LUPAN|nr:PREDICTED: uncharacterized protein LOC109362800 [Lupinus angustifolius]OIW17711.1 hypothetical protein TanjilG_29061 [Lupinus angustifolius]